MNNPLASYLSFLTSIFSFQALSQDRFLYVFSKDRAFHVQFALKENHPKRVILALPESAFKNPDFVKTQLELFFSEKSTFKQLNLLKSWKERFLNGEQAFSEVLTIVSSMFREKTAYRATLNNIQKALKEKGFDQKPFLDLSRKDVIFRSFSAKNLEEILEGKILKSKDLESDMSSVAHTMKGNRDTPWLSFTHNPSIAAFKYNRADQKGNLDYPIGVFDLGRLKKLRSEGKIEFYDLTDPFDFLFESLRGKDGEKLHPPFLKKSLDILDHTDWTLENPFLKKSLEDFEELKKDFLEKFSDGFLARNDTWFLKILNKNLESTLNVSSIEILRKWKRDAKRILKWETLGIDYLNPEEKSLSEKIIRKYQELLQYRIDWISYHVTKKIPIWGQFFKFIQSKIRYKKNQKLSLRSLADELLFSERSLTWKNMQLPSGELLEILNQRNWDKRKKTFFSKLKALGLSKKDVQEWFQKVRGQRKHIVQKDEEILVHRALRLKKTFLGSFKKLYLETPYAYPLIYPRYIQNPLHQLRSSLETHNLPMNITKSFVVPNAKKENALLIWNFSYEERKPYWNVTVTDFFTYPMRVLWKHFLTEAKKIKKTLSREQWKLFEIGIYKSSNFSITSGTF